VNDEEEFRRRRPRVNKEEWPIPVKGLADNLAGSFAPRHPDLNIKTNQCLFNLMSDFPDIALTKRVS
jgi:hypothetical protein